MARLLAALALLATLAADPAAAAPADDREAAALAAEAAAHFAAGDRDGAIEAMRDVVDDQREAAPDSLRLAEALTALAGYLDAPDGDRDWQDAEDLRLEAIDILEALDEDERVADAVAALAIHYIRRAYGRDFTKAALRYLDLVEGEADGDARAGALVAEACARAKLDDFPKLALDLAPVATAYLARFSAGDDAAVACVTDALARLLAIGRELDGLLSGTGELARLALAPTVGAVARLDALELRGRVLLAAGRTGEALAIADAAVAAAARGTLRARALALRAEARFRDADIAGAAADATDAVLAFEGAPPEDRPRQALAVALLAEILSTLPDRQSAVPALLARARDLARSASEARTPGWEEALGRAYSLIIARQLAEGDPAAASATADELARFNAEVLKISWLQDWANLIDFPANIALLLYRQEFEWAEAVLRTDLDARYYAARNYFLSPLVRADIAEYSVLLALVRTDRAGTPLDAATLTGFLDDALEVRAGSLPPSHPLVVQHFALRAVTFARLGRTDAAIAAAREGLRRFVEGGGRRRGGGTVADLFIDPVYKQLVIAAWLESLPR